jgi:anti-anti-sigma regulatory factor
MSSRILLAFAPPAATLHLFGELDIADRRVLRRRIADLARLDCTEVQIDASKVTYVDCACLWELASGRRRMELDGRTVTLRAMSTSFCEAALAAGYPELVPPCRGAGSVGARPHRVPDQRRR